MEKDNDGKEYDVQFNDWVNPRFRAVQWIRRIIGLNWLDKYQLNRDTYRVVETSQGEIASIWVFGISTINIVAASIMQAVEVSPN